MVRNRPYLTIETAAKPRTSSKSQQHEQIKLLQRSRRHSYNACHDRDGNGCHADAVYLRVDVFLRELKLRLHQLERYRHENIMQFNAQLERGYQAMKDVRDSCAHYSDELLCGAAKYRAGVLVATLETKYHDMMPAKATMEHKAQTGIKMMETWLVELETRTTNKRNELLESSWRAMDSSLRSAVDLIEEGFDKALKATEVALKATEVALKAKDVLKDSISLALTKAAESRLIHYEDLPIPWRNNPHIKKGYRFSKTKIECVTSILHPSNETFNIWSHLIGLMMVLAIAFHYYPSSATFAMSTNWDIAVAACFFVAACKCLICSSMWHTMNSIADQHLLARFACVDYTGISFLVAASIMSIEWTAFYCEPVNQAIYLSFTLVMGIAGVILPWKSVFDGPHMAWARVAFYVTLVMPVFLPYGHLTLTQGSAYAYYFYAPLFKSLGVYLAGAIIYASKVPERWFPGFFDYAGCSHNIWHLAVLGGILFHYSAMIWFFQTAFATAQAHGCKA